MVQDPWFGEDGKQVRDDGEPAAKKHCKQLSETSPLQLVQFTGANEGKAQGTKRNAPQDHLSAVTYPRVIFK